MSDGQNGGDAGAVGAAGGAGGADGGAGASDAAAALLGGGGAGGAAGGSGGDGGVDAGAGAGGADGGAAAPDAAVQDFLQKFSADAGEGDSPSNRDWIAAKGFKDIDGIIKAHRAAEKALHDTGRVKIPGDGASAEEMAAFRKAVGVPDDAKGYEPPKLTDSEGKPLIGSDGAAVEIDGERFAALAGFAHEAGMPKAAFEAVMAKVAELDLQQHAEAERDIQRRADAHAKKWGSDAAEKTAAITRAGDALGLTREQLLQIRAAIGPEAALDMFAKLGAGISEDTLVQGGGRQRFGLSGAEAQKTLDQRMSDKEWRDKVMVPGTPQNAEYRRLNDAIAEDVDRKARQAA